MRNHNLVIPISSIISLVLCFAAIYTDWLYVKVDDKLAEKNISFFSNDDYAVLYNTKSGRLGFFDILDLNTIDLLSCQVNTPCGGLTHLGSTNRWRLSLSSFTSLQAREIHIIQQFAPLTIGIIVLVNLLINHPRKPPLVFFTIMIAVLTLLIFPPPSFGIGREIPTEANSQGDCARYVVSEGSEICNERYNNYYVVGDAHWSFNGFSPVGPLLLVLSLDVTIFAMIYKILISRSTPALSGKAGSTPTPAPG